MTDKRQPSEYKKIDPDDFHSYEEQYIKKGSGGGSSAKGPQHKGKKTIKALMKQQRELSRAGRRTELKLSLKKVLKNIPVVEDQELQEKYLNRYIAWIENNKSLTTLGSSDLIISFSKSGGPGGQNVNKRETKVTLFHQPTFIQVDNDQTRSQLKNKELAREILLQRLRDHINDWKEYLAPDQGVDLELVQFLRKK